MKPIIPYESWSLFFLEKIDPKIFGGCYHLVFVVKCQGIRKNDGSTPTAIVSSRLEK